MSQFLYQLIGDVVAMLMLCDVVAMLLLYNYARIVLDECRREKRR